MQHPRSWLIAICVAGGAVGLAMSYILSPPPGADHPCPQGSTPSDCHYAPDQTLWSVWWTLGCLVLGMLIGLTVTASARHDLDPRRP
jgi:hypothetical protein